MSFLDDGRLLAAEQRLRPIAILRIAHVDAPALDADRVQKLIRKRIVMTARV